MFILIWSTCSKTARTKGAMTGGDGILLRGHHVLKVADKAASARRPSTLGSRRKRGYKRLDLLERREIVQRRQRRADGYESKRNPNRRWGRAATSRATALKDYQ